MAGGVSAPGRARLVLELEAHPQHAVLDVRSYAPGLDLTAVEDHPDLAALDQGGDLLALGQLLGLGVDELQLSRRPDEAAHLVLIAHPGHVDHDPLFAGARDLGVAAAC